MNYETATNKLLSAYRDIFKSKGNTPDWACRKLNSNGLIHCPIPFVGRKYFDQPIKILVYASAENLSNYNGHIDDDTKAINRHRYTFEETKATRFFPNVHIQPFNNGALVLCAGYILSKLFGLDDVTPAEFLETIAFANYGKYTIETDGSNSDYAGNPKKLKESHEYIKADVEILQPDYIVMISQMYNGKGMQKSFIDDIKGHARIIPIYQITPTTINNPRTFRKFPPIVLNNLHPTLRKWYENFHAGAISSDYFLSVFTYLDNVLDNIEK